jgi:hypothetical protein
LIVEEKYQTAEMTPTSGEKETNKNKTKLVLAGIGLAVLIIIVIVIAVACSSKKNKPANHATNHESPKEPEEIKIDISHKLNEVLKYSEETTQTTSVNFNGDDSRLRSLAERKQSTTIKGNYLLNVYKVDNNVSPKLYYAYAILNKLTKQISGKTNEDNLGGEDITLLNEGTNKLPVIKFNFDENGEISNLQIPTELSVTLASYIYEFIQKVIIQYKEGKDDKRELVKKGEYTSVKTEYQPTQFGNNEDSSDDKTIEVNIKDKQIKEVYTSRNVELIANNDNQIDFVDSNFTEESTGNTLSTLKNFIEGINQYFDSKMILDNSDEDEEITNKINKLLSKVNFKEYIPISSSDKRLLGGIALNKFNRLSEEEKLRNLDTLITDPYYQPISYSYPIYRANYFGAKIGLFAKISFAPHNGLFTSQVILTNNNQEIEVFRDETYSNFGEVNIAIDDVLNN